jgi:hypothetical protein
MQPNAICSSELSPTLLPAWSPFMLPHQTQAIPRCLLRLIYNQKEVRDVRRDHATQPVRPVGAGLA